MKGTKMRRFFVIVLAIVLLIMGSPLVMTPVHAQQSACADAPPARFSIGMRGAVLPVKPGESAIPVRVRDQAGRRGLIILQMQTGAQFTVVDGPQCADGFTWWQITTDDQVTGWTAEGSKENYFIDPIASAKVDCPNAPLTRFAVGATGLVRPAKAGTTPNSARLRDSASTSGKVLSNIPENTQFTVTGGPVCTEGYVWWEIKVSAALKGWTAEGDRQKYYIIPIAFAVIAAPTVQPPKTSVAPTPTPRSQLMYSALAPDDKTVFMGYLNGTGLLFDAQTGGKIREFKTPGAVIFSVAYSPDSHLIVTGDQSGVLTIWNTTSDEAIKKLAAPNNDTAINIVFTPDGKRLLTNGRSGTTRLWDLDSGAVVREFKEAFRQAGGGLAVSPDGKQVVTGGSDATVTIWDMETGAVLHKLIGHKDFICGAAFSPDGKIVLTGGLDGTMRLWDAATGNQIRQFEATDPLTVVYNVAYSHDGKYALSANSDQIARLWDVATGKEIRQFVGHDCELMIVAFSSDDALVFTSSDHDGTARLWNAATGKEIRRFQNQ